MKFRKDYFRYYIYGYLNVYYTDLGLHNNDKIFFKEKRKEDVVHYLRLKGGLRKVFMMFSPILSHLEILSSIFILIYQLLIVLLKYPFCQNRNRKMDSLIIFGAKSNIDKFNNLINSAQIDKNRLVVILSPFTKINFKGQYTTDNLLSGITIWEILQSFTKSIGMSFFMTKRYSKYDNFFRAYSSFEFFMMCFFFERIENDVYYTALIDRRAFLFGNLKCKVIFLQHGKVNELEDTRFMIKIGKAEEGYFIDEHQRDLCYGQLFYNEPIAHFLPSFEFSSNHLLINNGKKNVLLVCNHLFFDIEKTIISMMMNKEDVNLYIKPHPGDEPTTYKNLVGDRGVILGKKDFPHVDLVISYDSTLAIEYQSVGVPVIYHSKENYIEQINHILS